MTFPGQCDQSKDIKTLEQEVKILERLRVNLINFDTFANCLINKISIS